MTSGHDPVLLPPPERQAMLSGGAETWGGHSSRTGPAEMGVTPPGKPGPLTGRRPRRGTQRVQGAEFIPSAAVR